MQSPLKVDKEFQGHDGDPTLLQEYSFRVRLREAREKVMDENRS